MAQAPEIDRIAEALLSSVRLLVRRVRQVQVDGGLPLPERSALSRLDAAGPTTSAALARREQISPQSMGATLRMLESRGLIERSSDPNDGRRVILSVTDDGLQALRSRRSARAGQLSKALSDGFTPAELAQLKAAAPLLERLAQVL
jgi:DNA-binding MarR family transcriptional regulator